MSNIVNIPNPNTAPGAPIYAYNALGGKFYITKNTKKIVYCAGNFFLNLDGSRHYAYSEDILYPITLDTITANFSYEKNLPTWNDNKNWIDGPDSERIDENEQPKTTFYVSGTYFVRFNVNWDEAKDIATKFSITQIIWKGKQMFLVDGIWIGE